LSFVALAFAVSAQQPDRISVVGVLLITAGPNDPLIMGGLRQGLRKAGYVEGRNIRIEHRYARGHVEDLPRLAEELVRLKVDVIVVGAEPLVRAAKQATSTIPIVMVVWDRDPIEAGSIDSFNRPGGNVTGIFTRTSELAGKRLELLKEAMPSVSRIAVLWDSFGQRQLELLEPAARSLGVQLHSIEMRAPYDFGAAIKTAKRERVEAMMVMFSPVFYVERARIAALALDSHMPTMYQEDSTVLAGGLISYGPTFQEMWFRAGYFVDRLLKGAKPSELPVEQATKFRLVVNLKTAQALGLTMPQSILLRADEVIR
jgi:putative ABC transport system substrate-binding protein